MAIATQHLRGARALRLFLMECAFTDEQRSAGGP
jgi:hypothetical protein